LPRLSAKPVHIFFKGFCTPDGIQEFTNPIGGIVLEPEFVGDRHDAIGVGGESFVAGDVEADVAGVSVDQTRFVQTVAAHHAADSVGD
jgi:hypothetical protein